MSTSSETIRAWTGPAVFSYGFRPFFLGGALWAAVAMALWVGTLSAGLSLPARLDPVSWHAHEFLFGYVTAIVAGFLLTAVASWTGRSPVLGWPLGALFALWLAGRVAVAFSALLPPLAVALVDLAMLVALVAVIAREIIAGQSWRNLIVLTLLIALIVGNALFHWDAYRGTYAAGGVGLRLGLGATVMMIAVIGGRIVPAFTRNWLVKRGETKLPAPIGRFDALALAVLLSALVAWIAAPAALATGAILTVAALVHSARLLRWMGNKTGAEPLVWVLHVGYALVPFGALMMGLSILTNDAVTARAAQHVWMAGAIGLMTLAVMTRATLGHTGRALHSGWATTAIYILVMLSVVVRLLAGTLPAASHSLHLISGLAWIGAFGVFIARYGPMLLNPREAK